MASCDYTIETILIHISGRKEAILYRSCLGAREMKWDYSSCLAVSCLVLPSVAVRVEPLGLCVCILSGIEPGQLVEGPGASLSSEVEA